jgi:flagellar hook-associated protein 3 FlgL
MVGGYLRQLNDAFESQTKLMEQSDGSSLHRPSDNAVNYSKYLRYEVSDTENNQYTSNVNTAVSWMTTSDNALVNVTSILKTVNEKTTAAANDTNNNKDWAAIGKEVMAELQEAVSDMNMQSGDRYVFSGQNDLVQPFVMSTDNVTRGLTKTLDSNQKEFFKSTVMFKEDGTVTTDKAEAKYTETCNPSQMMAMTGDDGKEYYLNTYTGKFYAKDFPV